MPELDLSKGFDLSALSTPAADPPGTSRCEVDGGCNFLVQGDHAHEDKDDCLKTALPYVQLYMETEEAAIQMVTEYKKLEAYAVQLKRQNTSLLNANQQLLADVDKYAADLRRLRKDNPEEQKNALLEAAGDLVKAVKPADKVEAAVASKGEQLLGWQS